MEPHIYTVIELECKSDRHFKFYRGYLDHNRNEIFFQYGRIGTFGAWTDPQGFDDFETAQKAFFKKMKSKMVRGYSTTKSATFTCNDAVPVHLLHNAARTLNHDETSKVIVVR